MNVQTLCKDENANNPYNQNINLVFPSGIGMITGTASTVDLNVNSGNPCGNQVHPTFDATLFSPQELQFGLHIKNKINKWNFSQVANLDSISLIFETLTSSRKINIYEDKITICDGEIESPIVTLTDLFTIGNDYVSNNPEGGMINMGSVVSEINQMVIDDNPLTEGIIFPEIIEGEYPQLGCWQFEGGCPNTGDESSCKCRTATCEIEHKWIECCEELRDPLCSVFNETIVNVIVEIYDKEGVLSVDEPLDVVEITGNSGDIFIQLGENEIVCEEDLSVGYNRFNDCYRLMESYHTFTKLETPSIPLQLLPEAPENESSERGYLFENFVSNEEETHYGEVVFKFERVPVEVEIIMNIINSSSHNKLPVNVIEGDNNLSITTFNGNNINEINDLRCGLDYTIEFEKLHCYEFVDSSNDLGLSIPDDLGKFVFPAPTKNGIIEFNYKLKEITATIIFEFEDDFEHCGTDENIANIKDIISITGYITNVLDEQELWTLDSYDDRNVIYKKENIGCANEVQVGFNIDCECYEFIDSMADDFGIDGGLENGQQNYIFNPLEDGTIIFKFKRKIIEIEVENIWS